MPPVSSPFFLAFLSPVVRLLGFDIPSIAAMQRIGFNSKNASMLDDGSSIQRATALAACSADHSGLVVVAAVINATVHVFHLHVGIGATGEVRSLVGYIGTAPLPHEVINRYSDVLSLTRVDATHFVIVSPFVIASPTNYVVDDGVEGVVYALGRFPCVSVK